MRPMRMLLLSLCAAVLFPGCAEEPQDTCAREIEAFCADRGGCTDLLRSLELKSCVLRAGEESQSS